jgi:hypothetical protein
MSSKIEKKPYRPTKADIEWIAGRRVPEDKPIMLTDREAEHDLARGNIALVPANWTLPAPAEAPAEDAQAEEMQAGAAETAGKRRR